MSVKGSSETSALIKQIRDKGNDILMTATLSGALIVVNSAKEKAHYKTGNLKRSIHEEPGERTKTTAIVKVGTDVEYARREEFGFIGKDSLGRVYHYAGKPYLRPAIDENKGAVTQEVQKAYKQLLGG